MQKSKWATPERSDTAPASVSSKAWKVLVSVNSDRLKAPEPNVTDHIELAANEAPQAESILAQPVLAPSEDDFPVQPEAAQPVPTYYDSMNELDEFAQTRPPDDLFSDEFEPITDPVIEEPIAPIQSIPSGPRHKKGTPRNGAARQVPNMPANGDHTTPAEAPRPESVRGDRSKTGGIKKTKLTENELSQRMEAVRLKNQSLEAAHARAEADEASFQAREAEDIQKRKLERQNRQQMMGEREKNRQRKINQLGGREWDADKADEQDAGRGSQYRRGAHGGIVPDARPTVRQADDDLSQYIYQDNARGGRGRGKGQGAGTAGRGRGRGRGTLPDGEAPIQAVPTSTDFPSLSIANPPAHSDVSHKTDTAVNTSTLKPDDAKPSDVAGAKSTWADEMETPIEPRVKT